MGGIAFPSKGSIGAAATTSWFAPIPDKFTMALPGQIISGNVTLNNLADCKLVNAWKILVGTGTTATLGAFTTAPDGTTNTMQRVVETAITDNHGMGCAVYQNSNPNKLTLRSSVYAKLDGAGRTRFAMYICDGVFPNDPGGTPFAGCKTVFDVAGGQIGVASTAYNTAGGQPNWTPGPTEIKSIGGGVFRCTMDVITGSRQYSGICVYLVLDNGSGTAAESTSYLGDVTKGMYFWKASLMPPSAWAMAGSQVFFDDFTSLSTIDLTNSKAAGFNWYINNNWPAFGFNALVPSDPTAFSIVNGTQLKIAPHIGDNGLCMMTAVTTGGNGYRGIGFQPPFLVESSLAWDWLTQGGPAFWTVGLHYLTQAFQNDMFQVITGEVDYIEQFDFRMGRTVHQYGAGGSTIIGNWAAFNGFPAWGPLFTYADGGFPYIAQYTDDVVYQSSVDNNVNNIPPSTVGVDWSVATGNGPFTNTPPHTTLTLGPTSFHTFSVLWLPAQQDQFGQLMGFMDGLYCAAINHSGLVFDNVVSYSRNTTAQPGNAPPSGMTRFDSDTWPVMFGQLDAPPTKNIYIDWVKVTK